MEINSQCSKLCPNFLGLVDLLLCLPASSVDAERTFNQYKIVKSDWRSILAFRNVTDLLLVQLEAPSIEDFDPMPAIQLWNKDSSRGRQCFNDTSVLVDKNDEVQIVDDVQVVEGGEVNDSDNDDEADEVNEQTEFETLAAFANDTEF